MIIFSGAVEKSINYSTPQSKFASWVLKGLANMASSKTKKSGLTSLSADAMPAVCADVGDCPSMSDRELSTVIIVVAMPDGSLASWNNFITSDLMTRPD
jgi:hypothetical protein